jgi:hypothetical protein
MPNRYRHGGITFAAPAWDARVIHVFTAASAAPRAPTLLVMEDALLGGEKVEHQLRRCFTQIAREVRDFRLHQVSSTFLDVRPAQRATLTWTEGNATIRQDRVHLQPDAGESFLLTIVFTARQEDFARQLPEFERMLASVRSESAHGPNDAAFTTLPSSSDSWMPPFPMPGTRRPF